MKKFYASLKMYFRCKHYLILIGILVTQISALAQNVVISQVYGGGGNSGATYKNDFIELYNPTGFSVDLTGWSVQYSSASGTTWQVTNLSGFIASGGYYLVQEKNGSGGTVDLPTPDALGTLNLSGTNGKVALVNSTTALSGCPSTGYIDLVGFGSANCFEGSAATPVLSNTTSAQREIPCVDTNDNANDFKTDSPNPHSSSSPPLSAVDFTTGYPKIQFVTSSGFKIVTNLVDLGTTYFVILPSGEGAPTSAQVKNGQDANGTVLSTNLKGSVSVTSSATEFTIEMTNMAESTSYDIYFVNEQCALSTSPVLVQATTLSALDVTPPNYTSGYPKIQNITSEGFQLISNLDEVGHTYFVVIPNGAIAPSPTQVKAGQDGNGSTLASNLYGQIIVSSPSTDFSIDVSALSPSSDYSIYLISDDLASNLQTSVIQIDIATTAPPVLFEETFNTCNGTGSFSQYSVAGAQSWGCTDYGRSSSGMRMNGYSGGAVENEDWLISPVINLSLNASLSFYSQFSFAGSPLQLKISTDYTGEGDPNEASWLNLNGNFPSMAVASSSNSLSNWTLSNIDLSSYSNQNVYVAFVYTSSATAASRWTLDEITFTNAVASYLQTSPSSLVFNGGNTVKNYLLKGFNLANDVVITAPSNFGLSKNGTAFSSSISFTAAVANAQPTVYVQFNPPTGSIDKFTGEISISSLGVATENVTVEGRDKSKTLDVVTYNLEFFGADVVGNGGEFGPADDPLQISNVTTVMQTIGADIYGVEEISNDDAFNTLVSNLAGYDKIVSDRWSYSFNGTDANFPPQKIGFIYNTSTVQVVSSRVMFADLYDAVRAGNNALLPGYPTTGGNAPSNFWSSGRLPFMTTFDVTINGVKKRIRMINIHAKSGSDQASYDRKQYDVKVLHDSLVANYPHDNIILLGDFNDDVDTSIATGLESSYKIFVADATNFSTLTYELSLTGASSYPNSNSFLDHIIISNKLTSEYVSNSITIEDPRGYIANYINTTSDHLPVSAQLIITKEDQTITFEPIASKTVGDAAFTISATSSSGLPISFSSPDENKATISGHTATLIAAGAVTITASQVGDDYFNAAPSVEQSFCIKPEKPTLTISGENSASPTLTSSAPSGNQWYFNNSVISGATSPTLDVAEAGTYYVEVKVDSCISPPSDSFPVIITGDIAQTKSSVSLYPNPANQFIFVTGIADENIEARVTTMLGQSSLIKFEHQADVLKADVSQLSPGFYIFQINQGNILHQIKFIKQ